MLGDKAPHGARTSFSDHNRPVNLFHHKPGKPFLCYGTGFVHCQAATGKGLSKTDDTTVLNIFRML